MVDSVELEKVKQPGPNSHQGASTIIACKSYSEYLYQKMANNLAKRKYLS
jgi:hypothetical protein